MNNFNFYTYDVSGRDIVVSVKAENEQQAWAEFRKTYTTAPVDIVVQEEKSFCSSRPLPKTVL